MVFVATQRTRGGSAVWPRACVAIRNPATRMIATVSVAETTTSGVFIGVSIARLRAIEENVLMRREFGGQPEIGMAATTLIDSTVTVTSKQTDSEATASEAASAFDNRAGAKRADRSPKPIPETGDRSMVVNPQNRQRITP
ncbi:hypothetical protein CSIRO_0181 [Bradyrhizobiaceae bacterium SG-6C]|nr:hypothetical protein CSIRO_0181 [Bradyrhizobiaceae bacterium SG-6C]